MRQNQSAESNSLGRTVVKAAGLIGILLILSRILGFVRNASVADIFGQGHAANMYSASFLAPDAVYSILIGGAVSSAFIPVLSRYFANGEDVEAWKVVSTTLNAAFLGISALVIVGIFTARWWIVGLVPGFNAADQAYTAYLSSLALGSVLFNSLCGVLFGVQSSRFTFWATGTGPVLFNVVTIIVGVALAGKIGIAGFSLGALLGSIVNFLTQVIGTSTLSPIYSFKLQLNHPGVRRVGRLMVPILISGAASQIALVLNQSFLASFEPAGVINALVLSSRIMLVPVSLGATIGIALLPALASHAVSGDSQDFRRFLGGSLRAVIYLTIPATCGLILLARPFVAILFQHGHFTPADTLLTAQSLTYYSLGIVAYSALEIVYRAFYAFEDTVTPFKVALGYLAFSVLLNVVLIHFLAYRGLALAYSLSGFFNLILLLFFLRRRLGSIDGRALATSAGRSLAASAGMVATILLVQAGTSLIPLPLPHFLQELTRTLVAVAAGGASFMVISWLLGAEEAAIVTDFLRRRRAG